MGIGVVKSTPSKNWKSKKLSEREKQQQHLFSLVNGFLTGMDNKILNTGYQFSGNSKMTAFNAALSYHIKHAVSGEYPDYRIEMDKVKLSRPVRSTENGWNSIMTAEKDKGLVISWELNPFPDRNTRTDDQAVIVFYDKNREMFLLRNGIKRSLLTFTLTPLIYSAGHELYCWIFFVSADGKRVSETEYLGRLKMPEQQISSV